MPLRVITVAVRRGAGWEVYFRHVPFDIYSSDNYRCRHCVRSFGVAMRAVAVDC